MVERFETRRQVLALALSAVCSSGGALFAFADGFEPARCEGRSTADDASSESHALTDSMMRSFETACAAISEGSQVAVIAEGVPLKQSLTDDELKALQHSLAGERSNSVESVIARVATAYDYEAERARSGVFLLRKCYNDPNDLPCVTFTEMVHGFGEVLRFIDPEPPEPVSHGKDSVYWALWDSLTPDQQVQGPKGLRVSEMPTEQRALAVRATHAAVLETPLFHIWELMHQLNNLGDARCEFRWMKMVGGEAFGYQGAFRENGTIRQFPLNNGFAVQPGGAYAHTVIRKLAPDKTTNEQSGDAKGANRTGSLEEPVMPDPAAPTDLDSFLAPGMSSGRLPGTVTLGELAEQLATAESRTDRVTVDEGVAEKPIGLYGRKFTSNHDLVRGITDLYGLQVTVGEGGAGFAMRSVSHLSLFKPPHCLSDPDSLVLHVYMNVHKVGAPYAMVNVIGGYTDRSGAFVNEGGAGASRDVPKSNLPAAGDPQAAPATQGP